MSDGRESENLEADLTPNAQQVKEVLEQGVRDFVDVEEFKAAGVASPPEAPKDAPDAAVPPDLPTEADAAAYLGLLEIAASADVDQESATADAEGEGLTFLSWSLHKWSIVLGLFILAVVAALIAGRLLGNREAPPTGDSAQSDPASGTCTLDPSAVVVQSSLTETITKQDSTKTGYEGTSTFTNATSIAIYLNLSRSQSLGVAGQAPVEGWWDYQILLPPGEVHTITHTGQSWTNRDEPTWTVYTGYAAYPATDECRFAVGGDEALDALARPVANPLPVGPPSQG